MLYRQPYRTFFQVLLTIEEVFYSAYLHFESRCCQKELIPYDQLSQEAWLLKLPFKLSPLRFSYESASASSLKNSSTSVTRPAAWKLPLSASFVTTAGLISTTTVRTVEGSRLPVAMACSIEATMMAISTPCTSFLIFFWASCMSLMTLGMGPSSRMEPASTMGILRFMTS